jgi:hypothetical protein
MKRLKTCPHTEVSRCPLQKSHATVCESYFLVIGKSLDAGFCTSHPSTLVVTNCLFQSCPTILSISLQGFISQEKHAHRRPLILILIRIEGRRRIMEGKNNIYFMEMSQQKPLHNYFILIKMLKI